MFHPTQSRLTSQTTSIKRGSTIFFSGALTSIQGKLYLELHNFSYVRCQQNFSSDSTPKMPWSKSLSQASNMPSQSMAQKIHNQKLKFQQINKSSTSKIPPPIQIIDQPLDVPDDDQILDIVQVTDTPQVSEDITQTSDITQASTTTWSSSQTSPRTKTPRTQTPRTQTPQTSPKKLPSKSTLPPTPNSPTPNSPTSKRKTRSSYRTSNKLQKLADIASNVLDEDSDVIEVEES